MMKKIVLATLLLFTNIVLFAQDEPVTMADKLRSNGKIYVVVAVILIIFAGIIIYLIRLDRKISKLEKENKS